MANSRGRENGGGVQFLKPEDVITNRPCPPLCSTRTLSSDVDRSGPLHSLSRALFLKILFHVPPMELVSKGRLVCKYWLHIIDSQEFWRLKCQEEGVAYPEVICEDSRSPLDFRCIYLKRPFNRNFVKNWNAADEFNFWTIEKNGGDKFAVETNDCTFAKPDSSIGLKDCSKCWVTSYDWCEKSQTIDLLEEGCTREMLDTLKPTIEISDWTAARHDCGSRYSVRMTLESSEGEVLANFERLRIVGQWQDNSWRKVSRKFFNYPAGVRYVKILHGGKDNQYWAGHFGPKITGTCVMIPLKN